MTEAVQTNQEQVEFKIVILPGGFRMPAQIPVALRNSKYPFHKMRDMDMFVVPNVSLAQAQRLAKNASKAYNYDRKFEARIFVDTDGNDHVGIWRVRV